VARRSRADRAKFILKISGDRESFVPQTGNGARLRKKQKMESNMLNKLLVAAAMAAVAYATCPANAAKVSAGCSGGNLTKAESQIEAMADGEGKMVAQKEVAAAQEAMLNGKMGACAAHLGKAMQASTAK